MINFLHTFSPQPILISFGPINVYWYGIFIVTGILAGIFVILKLAGYYQLDKDLIIDSAFYLIIGGIIGARLYHIILELPFYIKNPLNIFMLWQGGLAIHGAIFSGLAIMWYLAKKKKLDFWQMSAIYLPGLAIAQAIGRWGNYFNQELFGRPTNLPWGIPIDISNRVAGFYNYRYFHPAFLYESLGDLIIFIILILFHFYIVKNKKENKYFVYLFFLYLIMYSLLRFFTEFIRIDSTPILGNLRFPQIVSLIIITISGILIHRIWKKTAIEKNI